MAQKKFYAVKQGRQPGIYSTWADCQKQTVGFKGAKFKGFVTRAEAEAYMNNQEVLAAPSEGVVAYVDGSYFNGNYSWGMAIYENGTLIFKANGKGTSEEAAKLHNVAGEVAGAMEADRPYRIQCPALLICGEKDRAGSCVRYNKTWHRKTGIPIEWIREAGSTPVLFETWARKDEPEKQPEMNSVHERIAKETGALLAPVGLYWWGSMESRPDLEMYAEDGAHASPAGSDFAAKYIWEEISTDIHRKQSTY